MSGTLRLRGGAAGIGAGVTMLAGARVLIVEDEFLIAEELRQIVGMAEGVVVGPVSSLRDAQAKLASEAIDAAILDINVRDGVVYPLVEELERRDTPFLFATGFDQSIIPRRYARIPRYEKPYRPNDIVDALRELLDRSTR